MNILRRNSELKYVFAASIAILLFLNAEAFPNERISNKSIVGIRTECLSMVADILKPSSQVKGTISKLLMNPRISEIEVNKLTENMLRQFHQAINTEFEDAPHYTDWSRETTSTLIALGLLSREISADGYFRLADAYLFSNIDRWELVEYLCIMKAVQFYIELEASGFEREEAKRIAGEYKDMIAEISVKYEDFIAIKGRQIDGTRAVSRLAGFNRYFQAIISAIDN